MKLHDNQPFSFVLPADARTYPVIVAHAFGFG